MFFLFAGMLLPVRSSQNGSYDAHAHEHINLTFAHTAAKSTQGWPSVRPFRQWYNKAWCPQVGSLDDICQSNLMTSDYADNAMVCECVCVCVCVCVPPILCRLSCLSLFLAFLFLWRSGHHHFSKNLYVRN